MRTTVVRRLSAALSSSTTTTMASTSTLRPGTERKDFRDANGKILPAPGETNVLITSALPYVNNAPHLGNIIGSTLSADVFARYSRTRNRRTLYICGASRASLLRPSDPRLGTDEYGTTTETRAMADGISPQELCDKYYQIHKDSYDWFELSFDHFGRTSTPEQTQICQDAFQRIYDNGFMEEKSTTQLYCETDKRFLADRFVEGTCPKCGYDDARGDQCDKCTNPLDPFELVKPRCKLCGNAPSPKPSSHLFIKLGDLEPQLREFVEQRSRAGLWSLNAQNLSRGWLQGGLQSRCMTRDLRWGVPVPIPGWEGKVMYVWFDAPFGYPSITAAYTPDWEKWWRDPDGVELYQFMGKDNVPFHTLFFPAYLMGTKQPWTMLRSLSTTEYLNYEGTKFSKSRGIGVFGENARDTGVPASVWRYYLLASRPETADADFTWNGFIARTNGELLNNLGNFVNRVLKFLNARCDSTVPTPEGGSEATWLAGPAEQALKRDVDALLATYVADMDALRIRSGLEAVMRISARGNLYLADEDVGLDLLKRDPSRFATVLLTATNLIYALSALVHPFMPSTAAAIERQLAAPPRVVPTDGFAIDLFPGHRIGQAEHLFKRIDPANEQIWRQRFGGAGVASATTTDEAKAPSKKAAAKAKQKAKAEVPPEGESTAPKPREVVEAEAAIKAQGDVVRQLKADKSADAPAAVSALLALKADLAKTIERLKAADIAKE